MYRIKQHDHQAKPGVFIGSSGQLDQKPSRIGNDKTTDGTANDKKNANGRCIKSFQLMKIRGCTNFRYFFPVNHEHGGSGQEGNIAKLLTDGEKTLLNRTTQTLK